jgi:hypothetical protein
MSKIKLVVSTIDSALKGITEGHILGVKKNELYSNIICFMSNEGMTGEDVKTRYQALSGSDWPKAEDGSFIGINKARGSEHNSETAKAWHSFNQYLQKAVKDEDGVPECDEVLNDKDEVVGLTPVLKKKTAAPKTPEVSTVEGDKAGENMMSLTKSQMIQLVVSDMFNQYKDKALDDCKTFGDVLNIIATDQGVKIK